MRKPPPTERAILGTFEAPPLVPVRLVLVDMARSFARGVATPPALSILAMLFAGGAAVYAVGAILDVSLFCAGDPRRGANIGHAVAVAFCTGAAGTVLVGVGALCRARRFMAAVDLTAAVALGAALILVAADSATWVQQGGTCSGFFGPAPPTATARFGYLYVAWGAPLAVLLVQAARLVRAGRARSGGPPVGSPVPDTIA